MSDIPNSNPLTPTFTPFRSGCGMCKPSTDYYSVKTGGGNYSNDGLIPKSSGQNFFKVPNFNKSMNGNFVKNNYGVNYSTSFGGKSKNNKSKKGGFYEVNSEVLQEEGLYNNVINVNNIQSPSSKTGGKKSKKIMKGGMESSGATPLPLRFFDPNAPLDNYSEISGNSIMTSYGQIESGDIGTGMLAPYTSSSCNTANHSTNMKTGGKKTNLSKKLKTTKVKKIIKDKKTNLIKDKKKMKGGESEFASINSEELPSNTYALYESYNNHQSGGKKSKKSMKGGESEFASINSEELPSNTYALYESYNNHQSGGKKSKKSMKGGESEFESINNAENDMYESYNNHQSGGKKSKKSMKGGESEYESFNNAENDMYESYNNHQSGGKKSKKTMKGGESEYETVNNTESDMYESYNNHQSGGKKSKKTMKGGESEYESFNNAENNMYESYNNHQSGGKKSKKTMKGGMESSGATSIDQRFYNPSIKVDNYNELAGNGIMSAYGPIESGNIGTGMLAPYTASSCNYANKNTDMKTGGSKSNKSHKKILKGGKGGPIPSISDAPVTSVQNTVGDAISGFTGFMQKLDEDYLKSVAYVKTIKIGNQRLIQGGKKLQKPTKKVEKPTKKNEKPTKKIEKPAKKIEKPTKKIPTKIIKKKGGGNGSDFSLTLNSRGPVNAPDDYWGVPGDQWFKQFNKTGEYIPNSQLAYAATPLLAGVGNNSEVSGYDSLGTDYGSV